MASGVKLILSRKAFDSGAGKVANPILDDRSMIADADPGQGISRSATRTSPWPARTWAPSRLTSPAAGPARTTSPISIPTSCHRLPREPGWRPLFGQAGAAQTVLARAGVGPGDLFLFFGWFRQATRVGGRLEIRARRARSARHVGLAPGR